MWDSAIRKLFCDLHRGAIQLRTSLKTGKRLIGSLLSLGVPGLTEFNGCLPFWGSSWHVTAVGHSVLDELIRELATSGAMANEGWEFSAAPFGGNSIPDSTSAPSWCASYPSSVRNNTQSARPESWTGLCIEMRSFQCRCFWNMLPDTSVLSQSFKQAGWEVAWSLDANLNPDFHLQNPLFFAVAVGLLLEGRVAVLNLPPLDVTIQVKLAQSQRRVKGYWIWIQSQSTATSVWDQAEVQCLLRDAHRVVRSTCLDGAPWSQNNEIVSNHCAILSLGGICAHKFHSGMSPGVNSWSFVASSFWQRFSCKLAGVWDWAQQMVLERSCVHLAGMSSPPGQSLKQFLHKTHFQPSGARPLSGVARKVGSAMQPVRRAVPQLVPEGLGTHFHFAVARDTEHLFLRPPTTYNPVVYATRYADVAEALQELADAVYSANLHALRLVDPFLLPVVARRNFLVMREVSVVISWVDPKLIVDLFFGMPQLGWATPAPTMQLREAPPEYPIEALKADCGNHNSKLISRCRPSGDDKLDKAAWEKTEEELSSEMILGPFFDLQDVPFPTVHLLRRCGTWEQHGGAENPTVRLIDDALEGGQNGATGSQFTHRPTDLDSWSTQCRMVQERFPQSALSQFPSDFKKAYKQVPAEPRLAGFAVMVHNFLVGSLAQ